MRKRPVFSRRRPNAHVIALNDGTPSYGRAFAQVELKSATGYDGEDWAKVKTLRPGRFRIQPATLLGDAPKDLVRVFEGKVRHEVTRIVADIENPATWPAYIAKVGHKCYPSESITEQLMTRLGDR